MRQSLSEKTTTSTGRGAAVGAVVLSLALAVAGIIDQAGGQSLVDHTAAVYASYGKQPASGLLYGLVYTVAVVNVLLWLLVARWPKAALAVTSVVITAALAVVLLTTSEYGAHLFPALWGVLALLPAVAGIAATVMVVRRSGR
ncbi:hypothetical protein AB0L70_20595 [Kribbella sp. NPDC051952]|uniref:hypothetical protein n=1 Tax=Kribbella sp. NPDC051952 TaxID=3154851 RepID=UPI0034470FCB